VTFAWFWEHTCPAGAPVDATGIDLPMTTTHILTRINELFHTVQQYILLTVNNMKTNKDKWHATIQSQCKWRHKPTPRQVDSKPAAILVLRSSKVHTQCRLPKPKITVMPPVTIDIRGGSIYKKYRRCRYIGIGIGTLDIAFLDISISYQWQVKCR